MSSTIKVSLTALALAFGLVAGAPACTDATLAPARPSAPATPDDAAGTEPEDAAPAFDDGTPVRVKCVGTLANGLTPVHGRLDGQLVSIVGGSERGCPSDPTHLHLQVKMNEGIYDIAVNLDPDSLEGETDVKMPGIPYAEGWHPMDLDYPADLGLHSKDLTLATPSAIRARVEAALTKANRISIFGTAYDGSDGAHIVHYKGSGQDGAIVVNPGAPTAHVIAFRFQNDTF